MSDECEFYYYDGDYCCRLLKNNNKDYVLNSDWVHRYCWGYNKNDCPHYNNGSSSTGCYLTSACVLAKGLPDDCDELQTIRHFRDTYLITFEEGRVDVEHYYKIAPGIVAAINRQLNANEIWNGIYDQLVVPCTLFIRKRQYLEAYNLYKKYALDLEKRYIQAGNEE